jgi:hypothetical protein
VGDLSKSLFGGSDSSSSSSNQSYDYLKEALSGYVSGGSESMSTLTNALNGGSGATQSYDAYKNSTGYANQLKTGEQAVTGSAASKGFLNSGSTAKALTKYGQNLADTSYNNYLTQLGTAAGLGTDAAKTVASAGQTSTSSSSSEKGWLTSLFG